MTMKYAYLVVEGPHDVEAIGRILKKHDFKRIENEGSLDDYWSPMIPRNFPIDGDLLRRVPVPTFFQKEGYSVAVHVAGGVNKIPKTLRLTLLNLNNSAEKDNLSAIGIFLDADKTLAIECCKEICGKISDVPEFSRIKKPGKVEIMDQRIGVFVFPNNNDDGTLENVLIECAEVVYPNLLSAASNYIRSIDLSFKQKWGQSDESKVIVGCIANVLRPGKSNQVSIQDNEWISQSTEHLSSVRKLNQFIIDLLGL
jgi:hypothetical protein